MANENTACIYLRSTGSGELNDEDDTIEEQLRICLSRLQGYELFKVYKDLNGKTDAIELLLTETANFSTVIISEFSLFRGKNMKYVMSLYRIPNLTTIFVLDEPAVQNIAEQIFSSIRDIEKEIIRERNRGNSKVDINMDRI